MSQNPAPLVYQSATDLHRAIMYAATNAPEIDRPCTLAKEMHGPQRFRLPNVAFSFRTGQARSSVSISGTRPRLMAMAEIVRKNWKLYGGGAKPADMARTIQKRTTWSATMIQVWRASIEDRDFAGAVLAADSLGAVYYSGSKTAYLIVAPLQVDGLPDGFVSARRCDGRWTVTHLASGCAIEPRGYGSRKAAEVAALDKWDSLADDKRAYAIGKAVEAVGTIDHDAARAAWCADHGIADPAAATPIPADSGTWSTPVPADSRIAELCAA